LTSPLLFGFGALPCFKPLREPRLLDLFLFFDCGFLSSLGFGLSPLAFQLFGEPLLFLLLLRLRGDLPLPLFLRLAPGLGLAQLRFFFFALPIERLRLLPGTLAV